MPIHLRIFLLIAGLQAASFMIVAVLAAVPIPVLDVIDITAGYVSAGMSWPWLLEMFNQHLLIVPRLLLVADIMVTGGHMLIFTSLALLAWCAVFLIVARHVRAVVTGVHIRLLVYAVLALAMFRCFLLESIVINNGFNYPFAAFFAVGAFAIATTLKPKQPILFRSSLAALAALASGFCLVNGMLALPIAAIIAGLRSRSLLAVSPFAIMMAFAIAVYLSGSHGTAPAQFDPGVVFKSLTSMFGAPWVRKVGVFGQGVGLVVIMAGVVAGLSMVRRLPRLDATDTFAAALLLFGAGSAVLIAVGRPDLSPDIGVVGRYALWPALVHAGIALTAIRNTALVKWAGTDSFRVVIFAGAALLMVEQARYAWMYLELGREMQQAAVSLLAGERSEALFDAIKSDQSGAAAVFDLYAARGLYGFR